jgi:hypothetical protein
MKLHRVIEACCQRTSALLTVKWCKPCIGAPMRLLRIARLGGGVHDVCMIKVSSGHGTSRRLVGTRAVENVDTSRTPGTTSVNITEVLGHGVDNTERLRHTHECFRACCVIPCRSRVASATMHICYQVARPWFGYNGGALMSREF